MPILLIACKLVLLVSAHAVAQTPLNGFARLFWGIPLSPLVVPTCVRAVGCSTLKDIAGCHANLGLMMDGANGSPLAIGPDPFFSEYVAKIGHDSSTAGYLNHLKSLLDSKIDFNLWTVTLNSPAIKRDKRKALQLLGALFQDKSYPSLGLPKNVRLLKEQVLKDLIPAIEEKRISGYPPGVETNMKEGGIYHFYSIALLAQYMADHGVARRYAAALPYSLNENYTTLQMSDSEWGRGKPKDLGPDEIYTGFAGAQFALTNDLAAFTGVSLKEFVSNWKKRGTPYVGDAFASGFGGKQAFCNDEVDEKTFFKDGPNPSVGPLSPLITK
jgi:hypothetical protein